jgi:hypothetical protein
MEVENLALDAAVEYLKAPRKGKVCMPFIREFVASRAEPPSKKSRATAEPAFSSGEMSMPGIKIHKIMKFLTV